MPVSHGHKVRAVVFREDDLYIAQCIEYDICAQASDIDSALDRLELTIHAECAWSHERDIPALDGIAPAPNYFHALWDKGSLAITRVTVPVDAISIEAKFANAA